MMNKDEAAEPRDSILFKGDVYGSLEMPSDLFSRLMPAIDMGGAAFETAGRQPRPGRIAAPTLTQRIDRKHPKTGDVAKAAVALRELAIMNDAISWDASRRVA